MTTDYARRATAYMRAITPRPSTGMRVSIMPGGASFSPRSQTTRRTGAYPGYGWLGNQRWVDASLAKFPNKIGSAIVDHSSGAKLCIKVSLSANTVNYEPVSAYPVGGTCGVDEVWFYVPDMDGCFRVDRTG
jgi:hypothetical protein